MFCIISTNSYLHRTAFTEVTPFFKKIALPTTLLLGDKESIIIVHFTDEKTEARDVNLPKFVPFYSTHKIVVHMGVFLFVSVSQGICVGVLKK